MKNSFWRKLLRLAGLSLLLVLIVLFIEGDHALIWTEFGLIKKLILER